MAVTLHFPATAMPAIITRLTTYLLERHDIFLQTCYTAEKVDFDIFNQQNQPIIRLRLRVAEDSSSASEKLASAASQSLTPDAVELLQHLLQTD
jgi:hypothetical protein